jgi:hypothetical protein
MSGKKGARLPSSTGGLSLQEVGDAFGFTRERARQIESEALRRLSKNSILRELAPEPTRYRKRVEPSDMRVTDGDRSELKAILDERFPFTGSVKWRYVLWPHLTAAKRDELLVKREMRDARRILEWRLGPAKSEDQIEAENYVRWLQ